MGAVLREQNALPRDICTANYSMAKPDVSNVGAGRAAKGAFLSTAPKSPISTKIATIDVCFGQCLRPFIPFKIKLLTVAIFSMKIKSIWIAFE